MAEKVTKRSLTMWKYTILRRAISGYNDPNFEIDSLRNIVEDLRGKTVDELEEIHKRLFGH